MLRRSGTTEKISVSVRSSDLASLRKQAKRLYGGNVSAVIAELAADAALLEGMHELVEGLGGPILTEGDRGADVRDPRALSSGDLGALAVELARVCPALLEQGPGSSDALARALGASRRWTLWWD